MQAPVTMPAPPVAMPAPPVTMPAPGGGAGGVIMPAPGGGVGGGAGGAGGAAGCCVATTGPATMTYVGPGQGGFTMETTYKYVGAGGEFAYVAPQRSLVCCWVGGAGALLLILALVLLFTNMPLTTTTTPKVVGLTGSCLLWGDPHVHTFDNAFVNFYDEGEWWLVKSPEIHIQGKFQATPYTKGLAAMSAIAVGGPSMQGHSVVVHAMDGPGQIRIDGQVECAGFPSICGIKDVVHIEYNGVGKLVDAAQSHLVKHIVHINAPLGVHLQVMRWANHVNAQVTMPPHVDGQDGACGNFNGNPADDTKELIEANAGIVPMGEGIFHHMLPPQPAPAVQCTKEQKAAARSKCLAARPDAQETFLADCVHDVCVGGARWAAQDGMAESAA